MIPVNEPLLDGNEKKYLCKCIDSGWISSEGPFVTELEHGVAKTVGRRYGVAVSSGTAALDIAFAALNLEPGDEVLMPAFTIISCAQAIVRTGATPVVIDSDPETWNMVTAGIEEKITARTKAILVVHIYGLPVDMKPVLELADQYGLKIIEDASQALGLTCYGRPCGGFGDLSTFSFYPNKHITTGEGGMAVTDDELLAKRCRSLRNLAFRRQKRFVHLNIGWNYRMSNLQAAVGCAQLERLDAHLRRKREIGSRYNELLQGLPLQLPLRSTPYAENCYWVYGILLPDDLPLQAKKIRDRLASRKIGTRPFFWPIHKQPAFKRMGLFRGVELPVAERLARRGFYLPSGLALTDAQIDTVAGALHEILSTG